MEPIIYADSCHPEVEYRIKYDLGIPIVTRLPDANWNVNDAMAIITDPRLMLAVVNQIDEVSVMEIALLHFMCKPILVTHKAIEGYPLLSKCVDFIDFTSNMTDPSSTFTTWFKWWKEQNGN